MFYDYLERESTSNKYSFDVIFRDKRGKYHISKILSTSFEDVIQEAKAISSQELKLYKICWEFKEQ